MSLESLLIWHYCALVFVHGLLLDVFHAGVFAVSTKLCNNTRFRLVGLYAICLIYCLYVLLTWIQVGTATAQLIVVSLGQCVFCKLVVSVYWTEFVLTKITALHDVR